jgi:trk system potassium uptake protein
LDKKHLWVDYEDKLSRIQNRFKIYFNTAIFAILLFGFLLVLYQIGFAKEPYITKWVNNVLRQIPKAVMLLFLFKWILKIILSAQKVVYQRRYISDFVIFFGLFCFNVFKNQSIILSSDYFLYILLICFFLLRFLFVSSEIKTSLLSPSILFTISFILLIFFGTAVLLIPNATNGNISLVDSLFITTSAVCVTGLASVDVPTKFTFLGQNIILILIQLGGLGLMTFTNFFAILFRGGMSLRNHVILSNLIETDEPNSLFSILIKIFTYTFLVECFGALLIYIFTYDNLHGKVGSDLFFAFFHAISAFCNAGFSILPDGMYNKAIRFNYNFQLVIAFLIIFGGIGFPVIIEIYVAAKTHIKGFIKFLMFGERFQSKARNLTVHSRIVLSTTIGLLLVGTLTYYFLERNNTLAEHSSEYGKWVGSFFGSVTPRTAGFNTVDMGKLMQGTILLYLLLMWIGAAPSSTGGGIKVTTFALAVSTVVALAKGKDRIELFKREISNSSVLRAFVVIFISLVILGVSIFFVSVFDPHIPLHKVAFECFSAYGTVGLSLNLTPSLSDGSKLTLVVCMFLGRVGLFTLLFGLFKKVDYQSYRYPKDSIQVM